MAIVAARAIAKTNTHIDIGRLIARPTAVKPVDLSSDLIDIKNTPPER
jgi:hypothetical protein